MAMNLRYAVMAALAMEAQQKAEESIRNDKDGTVRGHIVGHDLGVDENRRQPRNQMCVCKSGKKAKKCCITYKAALNKLNGETDES